MRATDRRRAAGRALQRTRAILALRGTGSRRGPAFFGMLPFLVQPPSCGLRPKGESGLWLAFAGCILGK